ncbi:hypothetical protein TWF481_011103 [Arthrobotrys musiformis]|uniref:Uncharacterized protein n=1 Tax=Arthrobotrys musiformis TaxID=47236 RepID=A0AAV9VZT4_9PEZI
MDPQDQATLQGFESRSQALDNTLDGQIQQLNARIDNDHPKILNGVSLVFTRLNDIATFINSDCDVCLQQPSMRDQYSALVQQLDEASHALISTVNDSEKAISNASIKLFESRSEDLAKLRAEIEKYKQEVDYRVATAQQQKESANKRLEQCSKNFTNAEADYENAKNLVRDAERNQGFPQVDMAAFGRDSPLLRQSLQLGMKAPQLEISLDAQREAYNCALDAYNTAKTDLKNANDSEQKRLQAKKAVHQYSNILPEAIKKAEQSLSRVGDVRKLLIKLKSLFQTLLVQVGKIVGGGEDTTYLDQKERVIEDILDVIDYGLVDVSLIDPARKIIRELKAGDDQGLVSKPRLATALSHLERKMQSIGPINWSNEEANEANFTPVI